MFKLCKFLCKLWFECSNVRLFCQSPLKRRLLWQYNIILAADVMLYLHNNNNNNNNNLFPVIKLVVLVDHNMYRVASIGSEVSRCKHSSSAANIILYCHKSLRFNGLWQNRRNGKLACSANHVHSPQSIPLDICFLNLVVCLRNDHFLQLWSIFCTFFQLYQHMGTWL